MGLIERHFHAMGTEVGVLIGAPHDERLPGAESMAEAIESELIDFDRRLSRFRPDSELSLLNQDPRSEVPASGLLRAAVGAGLWAAEQTGGLVDPTLLEELEAAGYRESLDGVRSAPLVDALATAPPRRPARPNPRALWKSIRVPADTETIQRPPGVKFDTGGVGKGLAADLVAARLARHGRYAIDCGGDIRVGGLDPAGHPIDVEIRHPLTGDAADTLRVTIGAVATSGLDARLWRLDDEGYGHHLLDPATGEPAWTGLIAVTARAPTAVEAEALAKAALLSGPAGASHFLARHGGLMFHESGEAERVGPLHQLPRIDLPRPS